MNNITLRIADLRKINRLTQQELADNMGVSFQTISKWERGTSLPDITVLPLLAEYFQVSTDQLLGLKPLDGEKYTPGETDRKDFWNNRMDYLHSHIRPYRGDIGSYGIPAALLTEHSLDGTFYFMYHFSPTSGA